MTDISYDADADAVYITVGQGKIERTEETGPFIYDVDAEGLVVGIENSFGQQGSGTGRLEKSRATRKSDDWIESVYDWDEWPSP